MRSSRLTPPLLASLALLLLLLLLACSCVLPTSARRIGGGDRASPRVVLGSDPKSPAVYCVRFDTNVQLANASSPTPPMLLNITRALAPLGADRLYALVRDRFFDAAPSAFFRVVPSFVVQFGISGVPALNRRWDVPISDDPVRASNVRASVSFATAGPNTRTTQLFINYADNASLDSQGFAPLGYVVRGFDVAQAVDNPTPGSSDGVDQDAYAAKGAEWIEKMYPKINSIVKASVTDEACVV